MKNMLKDVWKRDPKGFLTILLLNIAVSLTGGISIVMLIPMLDMALKVYHGPHTFNDLGMEAYTPQEETK